MLPNSLFTVIPKWKGLERICYLIHKVAHDALMTISQRARCVLAVSDACSICNTYAETIIHTFKNCSLAFDLWSRLAKSKNGCQLFPKALQEWLFNNLTASHKIGLFNWSLLFGIALDRL